MPCYDIEELEVSLTSQVSDEQQRNIRDHVAECTECKQLMLDVASNLDLQDSLNSALGDSDESIEANAAIPEDIGGYTVLREVGRGGMGIVYEAQQRFPRRSVALKILRGFTGSDSYRVKLFKRETQALARLKHPDIASIHDAGNTPDGQPYLVMDLVDGIPLDEFARTSSLDKSDRLKLFVRVCEAINYAHQRGVIHLDIKPSNIIVNKEGSPKVLDFGLARIIDPDASMSSSLTEIGKLQGTLPYMSPEQLRGDPAEIDLRSDVFSLGVILFELLTGQLPHNVAGGMPQLAIHRIHDHPPMKPRSINRTLPRDLETIMLKALEDDSTRRYQSALALAEDIERVVNGQPILARPPSGLYHFRKLVTRNKAPFATAFVLFLSAIGFGIWMSALYARAQEAEQIAQENLILAEQRKDQTEIALDRLETVVDFQSSMLSEIDIQTMGRNVFASLSERVRDGLVRGGTSEEQLDASMTSFNELLAKANATDAALQIMDEEIIAKAVETIKKEFADQPLVEASLRHTIGNTYFDLGIYKKALPQFDLAWTIRRRELGADHPDTLTSKKDIAAVHQFMGNFIEAEPYHRSVLESRQRVLGNDHPDTLQAIYNVGDFLMATGKYNDALPYFREALEGRQRVLGDDHVDTLSSINFMGTLLYHMGKNAEALIYYRDALERKRRVLGNDHPKTLIAINDVGNLLQNIGNYAEAMPYLRDAVDGGRRVLGNDHRYTLTAISNMGVLLMFMGKHAEALPYCREALEGRRRALGDDHPDTLTSINNMAFLFMSTGEPEEALSYFREALDGQRPVLGDAHFDTVRSINNIGHLLNMIGKHEDAYAELRAGESAARKTWSGANTGLLGNYLAKLGEAQGATDRFEGGEATLLEAYQLLAEGFGEDHARTIACADRLVTLYESWHKTMPEHSYDAEAAGWRKKLPVATTDK